MNKVAAVLDQIEAEQQMEGIIPDDMDLWEIAIMVVRGQVKLSQQPTRMLIEMLPYLRSKMPTSMGIVHYGPNFAQALERAIERSQGPVLLNGKVEQLPATELKKPMSRYRRF